MVIFFCLVLFLIGLAILARGVRVRADARKSLAWPQAGGTIVSSVVESSTTYDDGSTRTSYAPAVTYRYIVGGVERHGDLIAFGMKELYASPSYAERFVQRYPVGEKVTVYYDPSGSEAVLEPGNMSGSNTLFGMGATFIVIAIVLAAIL